MKLAALDVGTNTVLMLVVERTPAGELRTLADLPRITRLGRGVDSKGRVDLSARTATLDAIVEFADKARALGAEKIGVATAAVRDAADGREFLAEVKQRAAFDLEVISGDTEAQLSWLAVKNGLEIDPALKTLTACSGGGFTELILVEAGRDLEAVSLQLGSVRLTERFVHHDPPIAREAADIRLAVDEAFARPRLGLEARHHGRNRRDGDNSVRAGEEPRAIYPAQVHGHRLTHQEVLQALAACRDPARGAQEITRRGTRARGRDLRRRRNSRACDGAFRTRPRDCERPGRTLGPHLARAGKICRLTLGGLLRSDSPLDSSPRLLAQK